MIEHVVRRGLQHASNIDMFKRAAEEGPKIEMPKWGAAILIITFFVSVIFMSMVRWSFLNIPQAELRG